MNNRYESINQLLDLAHIRVLIIAHDIRSAYNIGAMLRTADGTGQTALVFVGYSPTPDNPKVSKTALGAEYSVPWCSTDSLDEVLAVTGVQHIGLELTSRSVNLFDFGLDNNKKVLLYVGNEVTGLPIELMTLLEVFVQLPMRGEKASLNVAEAASIAMYELLRKFS
ncbi:TrmH family RNA methyltransferase [bacterium]|nr:TrmH family RNA methyltransferase [bacterium]